MSEVAVAGDYFAGGEKTASEQAQYWADATVAAWRKTVDGIFETGRIIAEAVEQLPHGAKGMYYDSLPFSIPTANKLVSISTSEKLSILSHVKDLPASWGTLYELTTLTDSEWEAAEAAELIRPDLERKEISALKKALKKATDDGSIADLVACNLQVDGLIFGDCITGMASLPDSSIDLIVTDPPYNMEKADWDSYGSGEDFAAWCEQWLEECVRILKPSGAIYIFGINRMLSHLQRYLDNHLTYRNWIIWDTIQGAGGGLWTNRHEAILYYSKSEKGTYEDKDAVKLERHEENIREYKGKTYQFKNPSNVWRFPTVDDKSADRTLHLTQKPVEIIQRIIKASCPQSGVVLDPFMGSGTSAVAAIREGRKWAGFEMDEAHYAIACDRISREISR